MTRVDLEAVERMLNEATPGPWTSVYDATSETGDAPPCGTEWLVRSPTRAVLGVAYYDGDRAMGSEPDCALVAAAPTLIRSLIEEIERLRMLVAELMDSNDMACETPASACDCSGCSYAREESERV